MLREQCRATTRLTPSNTPRSTFRVDCDSATSVAFFYGRWWRQEGWLQKSIGLSANIELAHFHEERTARLSHSQNINISDLSQTVSNTSCASQAYGAFQHSHDMCLETPLLKGKCLTLVMYCQLKQKWKEHLRSCLDKVVWQYAQVILGATYFSVKLWVLLCSWTLNNFLIIDT